MTYSDQAALAADEEFNSRLIACCTEQANIFKDDGRADMAELARQILANAALADWFVWPVATQPGFGSDSASVADPQLLAAVQSVWPTVAAVHAPIPDAQ